MTSNSFDKLSMIFMDLFELNDIPVDFIEMRMGDIDNWDSIGNFNLLLMIEQEFNLNFTVEQLGELNNIRSIYEVINS